MQRSGYGQYVKAKTEAAGPLEHVAMILDRIAQHTLSAQTAILENRIEDRFIATDKAIILLNGLLGTLKQDGDPQTSIFVQAMDDFYREAIAHLFVINNKNDPDLCVKVANSLKEMAQMWRKASKENANTSGSGTDNSLHVRISSNA